MAKKKQKDTMITLRQIQEQGVNYDCVCGPDPADNTQFTVLCQTARRNFQQRLWDFFNWPTGEGDTNAEALDDLLRQEKEIFVAFLRADWDEETSQQPFDVAVSLNDLSDYVMLARD